MCVFMYTFSITAYTFEFFVYTDMGSVATPLHYFVPGTDYLGKFYWIIGSV